ncbi:hypothetical protein DXA32_19995 [Subdoligranulum sp. OF01-18]|uniref:phage minor capsid protein n=3 Tax=Ruthenibacterium lactatiformans TaxID=1550024 RepID=UPI000E7558A7|nr:phage minor capsid protein [Ruthenibacterium lactatiformans]RJW76301.1 hypothetical protein DXA32_19995 [Subdoligranulum sp. OF01-18]
MALTPDEIDGLRELILAVYGPVTEELLRDLCRCITAAGQISSGDEYKLLLSKSLAGADDVIADTLRRQTDLTDDAVEQLMRWAAEKTAPLEENESLRNIAEAYVKVTRKEVANVLGQLAAADVDGRVYPIKDVYRRTMDYTFREVSSGAKTPEEAVRRATLRLWQRGIRTIDRSDGRTYSVEFMAQRAIMTKMGEMTTAINEKHHDDGGCDGWEISAHSACAPDHEPIQGRQYSDKEYKRLNSRLQRRIGTLSCKHIAWPIKLGVDSPQWTDEQLAEMARENAKGITYEGRHYTQYEATQQQKALENSIRQCKDHIAAAQEEGKLGSGELRSSRILLRQLNAEYKRFSAAAGLRTAPERLRAAGLGQALKANGTLEMPRPAGTLTGSGGKLDVEEARKSYSAYLDTLTDAPEKNMVWLRYFTEKNPTEYMEDGTLDAPFAYDPVEDRILYNPRHPQFSTTDFEMANTHELAHRTDVLNAQGYKNKAFVDAVSDASKTVLDNAAAFRRVAQSVRSDFLQDIFSALSGGKWELKFMHTSEYWSRDAALAPMEIFAELFTMEIRNDPDLYLVQKIFPSLWEAYQKLL